MNVAQFLTLPLILSAIGTLGNVVATKLISDGSRWGWYVSVLTLVPTAILAIDTGAYFNALACIVYAVLYIRALRVQCSLGAVRSIERSDQAPVEVQPAGAQSRSLGQYRWPAAPTWAKSLLGAKPVRPRATGRV
jgi:hypothetical protein